MCASSQPYAARAECFDLIVFPSLVEMGIVLGADQNLVVTHTKIEAHHASLP